MSSEPSDLPIRPRRLRQSLHLRRALASAQVRRRDLILPVFVCEGSGIDRPVASMPGIFQRSVDRTMEWLADRAGEGFGAFLAFGVIERNKKDERGSVAVDPDNVVCQLLRQAREQKLAMDAITDLCFCEYTSHGHCGILHGGSRSDGGVIVDNDATLPLLVEQAIHHARAGAVMVAPSGMMDGAVAALRRGLDAAGFGETGILAYSVKYASAFYGPFRDAADSTPQFGDRRAYQMDPAGNVREALHEAQLDVQQGADMVMVKPAGPYLDVLAAVRAAVNLPVVAYQVSGEYSAIMAAGKFGWLDAEAAMLESLTAIKRAGADLIISYCAEQAGKRLER